MHMPARRSTHLAHATMFLLGWTAVIIPTVILLVERRFVVSDSGIGAVYFVNSACYIAGSLGGGPLVERLGRGRAFPAAWLVAGSATIAQGMAPAWSIFLLSAAAQGLGTGTLMVCANSLIIDAYPATRSNALSRLHVFYALGALSGPVVVTWLVASGMAWQGVLLASGLAGWLLAGLLALAPAPWPVREQGRAAPPSPPARDDAPIRASGEVAPSGTAPAPGTPRSVPRPPSAGHRGPRFTIALVAAAVAIACYVGSESAVTGWVVRFLSTSHGSTAAVALTMFWTGLAVGRILASRVVHRFDLGSVIVACALAGALGLLLAVLVPGWPPTVALFAVIGLAFGPVYPSIMSLASGRHPGRSASVSGLMVTAGGFGGLVYPPVVGFLSPIVGLGIGMLGAALLIAAAGGLVALGRPGVSLPARSASPPPSGTR
ncbi:MAG: MFS transporter [Candidatus Limnocylindrales bacterium]